MLLAVIQPETLPDRKAMWGSGCNALLARASSTLPEEGGGGWSNAEYLLRFKIALGQGLSL